MASFNTPIQQVVAFDKYSRWLPNLNRRETWEETCDRVIFWLQQQVQITDRPGSIPWEHLWLAMNRLEVMPSMRIVQMAGPALDRCHVGGYNCAYTTLESPTDLAELLYILMQGTGVGYSVEKQYIDKWQTVAEGVDPCNDTFVIEDSTEGWCESFKHVIERALWGYQQPWMDYSNIRPEGTWLHTKGGRASGPIPLVELHKNAWRVIRNRAGMKLRPFDIHRLACMAAQIVQVGGVRRSALLCLFDANDEEMSHCKDGKFWESYPELAQANNSAVYLEGSEFPSDAWVRLSMSQTGEPGIFRRPSVLPKRDAANWGTNPCFAKGTRIETTEGRIPIEELTTYSWVYTRQEDGTLGIARASASWKTRHQSPTLTIRVGNYKLSVTDNHQIYVEGRGWVKARNLHVGDRLCCILRQRRGAAYTGVKLSSEEDYRMEHRAVWEQMYGPLPEGWDIHHENGNTHDNRLSNLRPLPHSHHSYVTALEQPNNHQIKGEGGKFVSNGKSKKTIIPLPEELKAGIHQYAEISAIEVGPTVDVYDLSVEGTHNVIANGIVAHNCGEIILRPRQFCNLSQAVARNNDTISTLHRKVELATIFGTIQSTLTKFNYLRPVWKENCEAERLLGVDITGVQDCPVLHRVPNQMTLKGLRQTVDVVNEKYAKILAINPSVSATCNKPSGNSSQLLDCSSGIHPRYAAYYIRRLRLGARSPLAEYLRGVGVPVRPEVGSANLNDARVWVAEFPVKSPYGATLRNDVDALSQFETWLQWKRYWTSHNPSCTIYVKPDEWDLLGQAMKEFWSDIGGLSFLPKDDHIYQLAPYEEITPEKYYELRKLIPPLDLTGVKEKMDNTTLAQDYACEGDKCLWEPK